MIRMLRNRMACPALDASVMLWTWSAIMPRGVRSSTTLATGTPFSQVRMEVPIISTLNVFQAPFFSAFFAASCPSSVWSHPRRASS